MINGKKKLFLFFTLGFFFFVGVIKAQTSCDSTCNSNDKTCLTNLQNICQAKVTELQRQSNTLKNQIAQFDAQIKLTSLKISQTEEQIAMLGGRIDQLEASLDSLSKAFSSRAVETYKLSKFENNFLFILGATDVSDAVSRFHYLQKIQEQDRSLMEKLQEAQTVYVGEKKSQEELQTQLQKQKSSLNSQKVAKNNLLVATKNDESRYQSLLSQARAQLSALSSFSSSRGGGLISHRDMSDSWGKYYNQRDSNWGSNQIGLSSYSVWEVGCLLTSYAMVSSHFGGNITPGEVASNTGNFFSNTALFNSPGPSANGHSVIALENPSLEDLKNRLNSGAAIIAGLSSNGGTYPKNYSDHWVVLRSVEGDSFRINDPWYEGAMNVSLKDHYSGWTIIQARVYN